MQKFVFSKLQKPTCPAWVRTGSKNTAWVMGQTSSDGASKSASSSSSLSVERCVEPPVLGSKLGLVGEGMLDMGLPLKTLFMYQGVARGI